MPHTGGERIRQGSAEEAALKSWIGYLAKLSGPELAEALRYRQAEAGGYGVAPKVVLRRLTHSQYNNTVRDLLKDASNPANQFPPEDYVNGFKNQYEALSVSPILTEAYSRAAERLAANAFRRGDSRRLDPCKPASETMPPAGRKFIRDIRPQGVPQTARAGRNRIVPGDLQGRKDVSRRRAGSDRDHAAVAQLSFSGSKELRIRNGSHMRGPRASRISSGTPRPTMRCWTARREGDLNTPEGVERVTRRMLDDPKARDGVDEFVSEWLRFDRVMTASRERRIYPLFSRELARSMTEEARRFIGDLVWNDRNFMEVFTAKYSFINSDLAAVYKMPPPARDFQRVEFPPDAERAGLLGQALFLTLSSKPDETAPTGRGLFIREQFLCQQVPPPPPGVDTNLPPVEESKPVTNRERMAMHADNQDRARAATT